MSNYNKEYPSWWHWCCDCSSGTAPLSWNWVPEVPDYQSRSCLVDLISNAILKFLFLLCIELYIQESVQTVNVQFGEFMNKLKNNFISIPYPLSCLPSCSHLIQENHYPDFWRHSLVLSVKEMEWLLRTILPKLWKSISNFLLSRELRFLMSFKLDTFLKLDVHCYFVFYI